jgi:hypothetical protein
LRDRQHVPAIDQGQFGLRHPRDETVALQCCIENPIAAPVEYEHRRCIPIGQQRISSFDVGHHGRQGRKIL